ncbi:MAG: TIR domain-containing protein, partial [Bacteroidota bacterium]
MSYHLFISYSTNPDHRLALSLESFLEGLHAIKTSGDLQLPKLQICLDASDFTQSAHERPKGTKDLILENLAQSNELLVLCSSNAMDSDWVKEEVEWFMQHREIQKLRIAITDPVDKKDYNFKNWFVDYAFQEKSWYDFRQFRAKKDQINDARDLETEKLRLAADLIGINPSEIQPIWFREKLKNARRFYLTIVAALSIISISILSNIIYAANQGVTRNLEAMVTSGNDLDFINGVYHLSEGKLPK